MLSIGIVGLPNVGKSTLFNALTKSKQADAQNYPFCTIEPNVGVVEVPDERLEQLVSTSSSLKAIPTAIEFWDIAGLVKHASQGEGKGNAFLSNIKETDAIAHVVRGFHNDNIIHVENRVDPADDAAIINLELALADAQSVESRLEKTKRKLKGVASKEIKDEVALLEKLVLHLNEGKPARSIEYNEDEQKIMNELHLLTQKPMMYIVNVDDAGLIGDTLPIVEEGCVHIYVSAKTEEELSELSPEDAAMFMEELGVKESGLDRIVQGGYELLELVTFFTSGEKESRAWTVKKGTTAPDSAGVIHTDFVKGFIKADVAGWKDFVAAGGWNGLKGTGNMRLEGKQYIMQDGDVCYFHIN